MTDNGRIMHHRDEFGGIDYISNGPVDWDEFDKRFPSTPEQRAESEEFVNLLFEEIDKIEKRRKN